MTVIESKTKPGITNNEAAVILEQFALETKVKLKSKVDEWQRYAETVGSYKTNGCDFNINELSNLLAALNKAVDLLKLNGN